MRRRLKLKKMPVMLLSAAVLSAASVPFASNGAANANANGSLEPSFVQTAETSDAGLATDTSKIKDVKQDIKNQVNLDVKPDMSMNFDVKPNLPNTVSKSDEKRQTPDLVSSNYNLSSISSVNIAVHPPQKNNTSSALSFQVPAETVKPQVVKLKVVNPVDASSVVTEQTFKVYKKTGKTYQVSGLRLGLADGVYLGDVCLLLKDQTTKQRVAKIAGSEYSTEKRKILIKNGHVYFVDKVLVAESKSKNKKAQVVTEAATVTIDAKTKKRHHHHKEAKASAVVLPATATDYSNQIAIATSLTLIGALSLLALRNRRQRNQA